MRPAMSGVLTAAQTRRAEAVAFLIDAYDGVAVRPGKGLPHAEAVADVLRCAGYDDHTQLVALLHDVVEDTDRTVADVRVDFGDAVAAAVEALTEDPAIRHYNQRKRDLRARTVAAGSPVVDVAIADKIASLRHALITYRPVTARKLRHYTVVLQLALTAGLAAGLCEQLEQLIAQSAAAATA
jgi:guanosine-3',5'-bis(diphosphate) 3'-pyrophosphohydrolase